MQCQLCQRELKQLTVHHLIPKQAVKRKKADPGATVEICAACHRQLHSFYTNAELAQSLNTLEKLKSEPKMSKFLQWLAKQNPHKKIKINRHK
ncbi:MAG: hypothetical protein Tsb0014_37560 [Pleurocapsa sp.]